MFKNKIGIHDDHKKFIAKLSKDLQYRDEAILYGLLKLSFATLQSLGENEAEQKKLTDDIQRHPLYLKTIESIKKMAELKSNKHTIIHL